ncbi:hypothetical protein Tco_0364929 [Tanacetum coccineum]
MSGDHVACCRLFELAWLDFHELVLMDDLWSIDNHDFVVEMNAHRFPISSYVTNATIEHVRLQLLQPKMIKELEAESIVRAALIKSTVQSFDNAVCLVCSWSGCLWFIAFFFEIGMEWSCSQKNFRLASVCRSVIT